MSAKEDFVKLELLRERLKKLPPDMDFAADLIKDEIRSLTSSMSYGEKAKKEYKDSGDWSVVQVGSCGGCAEGDPIHMDDLRDGDIISDSHPLVFGPRDDDDDFDA